jgi:hypothetical protein
MGVLSDFFIATDQELRDIREPDSPAAQFEGVTSTGVDVVMLCTLQQFACGLNDWEQIFDDCYVAPVKELGSEGPWIYQVSDELCRRLSSLNAPDINRYAKMWAETDEWIMSEEPDRSQTPRVLSDLVNLARKATVRKKKMYLWTCL